MVVKTAAERIQIIWQMICDHRSRNSSAFYSKTYESVTASHKTGSRAHLNLSLQWTMGKVSRVVVEFEIWMKTPWQLPFQRKYILGRKAKKLSRVADVDVNTWIFGFGEVNTDLERNTEGRCLRFILFHSLEVSFFSFIFYIFWAAFMFVTNPLLFLSKSFTEGSQWTRPGCQWPRHWLIKSCNVGFFYFYCKYCFDIAIISNSFILIILWDISQSPKKTNKNK